MNPLTGKKNFIVKQANFDDVHYILQHMRPSDKDEILATEFDDDMERIAQKFVNHCELQWVLCLPQGKAVAFLAASRLWPHMAQIGFMATEDWSKIAFSASKWLKLSMEKICEHFEVRQLMCFADKRHKDSRKWLKWLGFVEQAKLSHIGKNG
ncbi:MAG: hypothetical protein ACK5MJ_03280, partial [Alphaproteobacteria bacterium]